MPRYLDDEDDFRPLRRARRRRDEEEDDEGRPTRRRVRSYDDDEEDYDDRPSRSKRAIQKKLSLFGLIAVIIGGFALVFSLLPCIGAFAILPGIAGVVTGLIGLHVAKKSRGRQRLALPVIGLSISAAAVFIAIGWMLISNRFEKISKQYEDVALREEEQRKRDLARAEAEVKEAKAGDVIQVSALQFWQAFDDDEHPAGERLYKGRVIEVTGVFHEIDLTSGDAYIVLLRGGPFERATVDCQFTKNEATRAKLISLRPGSTIRIRGKCINGGPFLEACILVE